MLTVAEPDDGRVMVSGDPCAPHVLPPVSKPTKLTSSGEEDAAVVGSTTTMSLCGATGWLAANEIESGDASKGSITNGTGFESAPGEPGLLTCTVIVPGDCTSVEVTAVTHMVVVAHVVLRGTPLNRIVDDELPLPAAKPVPSISDGKPETAPASTLEGRIASIVGPLVRAIVAKADFVGSASLVAVTEIALGDGAIVGAEYSPAELIEPQADPAHPAPGVALPTVHSTAVFASPVTVAKNCCELSVLVEGARNEYCGESVTVTEPLAPWKQISAAALRDGSEWLVAVRITGFEAGAEAGAK